MPEFTWYLPMLKSGRGVTDQDGVLKVVFASPFSDDSYLVSLSHEQSGQPCDLSHGKKTAAGFVIWATNPDGKPIEKLAVDWMCLPENNVA